MRSLYALLSFTAMLSFVSLRSGHAATIPQASTSSIRPGVVHHRAYVYERLPKGGSKHDSEIEEVDSPRSHSSSHSRQGSSSDVLGGSAAHEQHAASPERMKPSQMRNKEARAHAMAVVPSLGHGAYRAVAGVPLGIVGAASSIGGGVMSTCRGKFQQAVQRFKRVPDKLVGGIAMSTVAPIEGVINGAYHLGHAASCGTAAVCNKIGGNDRPYKGDTDQEKIEREKERGRRYGTTKTMTRQMTSDLMKNNKSWTKTLIKP